MRAIIDVQPFATTLLMLGVTLNRIDQTDGNDWQLAYLIVHLAEKLRTIVRCGRTLNGSRLTCEKGGITFANRSFSSLPRTHFD